MYRTSQNVFRRYSQLHVQRPVVDVQLPRKDDKRDNKDKSLFLIDVSYAARELHSRQLQSSSTHHSPILPASPLLLHHSRRSNKRNSRLCQTYSNWLVVCLIGAGYGLCGVGRRKAVEVGEFMRDSCADGVSVSKETFQVMKDAIDAHNHLLNIPRFCPITYTSHAFSANSNAGCKHIKASDDSYALIPETEVDRQNQHQQHQQQEQRSVTLSEACEALKVESEKCCGVLLNQYAFVYQEQKQYETALEFFIAAAEKNNVPALYNIGLCYELGHGVKKSLKKAATYYIQAADQGHVQAMFNVATFHYQKKCALANENEEDGFEYMKKAADKGHVQACSFVALRYAEEENWDAAFEYFDKAAKKNDRTSLFNSAVCLERGLGTADNVVRAGEYYLRAAELGHGISQLRSGDSYRYGVRGMKKDIKEALRWFERAAQNGQLEAKQDVMELEDLLAAEKLESKNIFSLLGVSGKSLVAPSKDRSIFSI